METKAKSRGLSEQHKCEANSCSGPQKLSYEELENVARQLSEQSKNLYTKLQEANMFNTFKRLDYLFKAVEAAPVFNDNNFIEKCKKEIIELMTINEETTSDNGMDSDINTPDTPDTPDTHDASKTID